MNGPLAVMDGRILVCGLILKSWRSLAYHKLILPVDFIHRKSPIKIHIKLLKYKPLRDIEGRENESGNGKTQVIMIKYKLLVVNLRAKAR